MPRPPPNSLFVVGLLEQVHSRPPGETLERLGIPRTNSFLRLVSYAMPMPMPMRILSHTLTSFSSLKIPHRSFLDLTRRHHGASASSGNNSLDEVRAVSKAAAWDKKDHRRSLVVLVRATEDHQRCGTRTCADGAVTEKPAERDKEAAGN